MSNNTVGVTKKIVQYGLSEVSSAKDPKVDIVFVHGLNGHPHTTWSTEKPDVFWPADLLPQALEEQNCRVLTYGYDANVGTFTDGTSKDKIHNHAEHLASRLVANRSLNKALERPIIFVCHSLGGLVVKRCLIYCKNVRHTHTERLRSIYVSTYGMLFLGTPHNGSEEAKWGVLLENICASVLPKRFFDSSPQLVEALRTNNETLQNINRLFIEIIGRYHVYFFHESKPMNLRGSKVFVVDEDSAAPLIEGVERMGIERDHIHICKFEDVYAPGYDVVAEAIQRYADDAPRTIPQRWEEERYIRELERRGAARELLGDSLFQMTAGSSGDSSARVSQPTSLDNSTSSVKQIVAPPLEAIENVPLLIAPLGFRPNSFFVGFELEMDQLRTKLRGHSKRKDLGSVSVLIYGPPGAGKSHLAREYLFRSRDAHDYPGGTFWVDCKREEACYGGFWNIGQAAALLGASEPRSQAWDAADKFLNPVRNWLEARDGWLLVFDGVAFDTEEKIEDFVKFIPDRKGNHIIFTSVDKTLARKQYLLNPTSIKVHPLSIDDARTLLFKSYNLKSPNSVQKAKATELVRYYECLPLAIHAVAYMLIAKGRALETFSIGSTDKRLAAPYLAIMQALRDNSHVEAVNLITILSFFNHNIPVALVLLGRKALNDHSEYNVEIRSTDREGSTKRELDNTIAVLIKYGLIERTLQSYHLVDSALSTNASLTNNGDPSPELIRTIETDTEVTEPSSDEKTSEEIQHEESISTPKPSKREPFVIPSPLQLDTRPESTISTASSRSAIYSIDILRLRTVVQAIYRDDLRLKDRPKYYWWLTVAVRLCCLSYRVADERIRTSTRQGLVRDYREFETQVAALRSYFPRPEKAPEALRKARRELHLVHKAIRQEIENRSPSQSFDSIRHRVQISIFERSSSTSSDVPDTPSQDAARSRSTTWSFEEYPKTDSPTHLLHLDQHPQPAHSSSLETSAIWDDRGYESGIDSASQASTTRRSSRSEATTDVTSLRLRETPNRRPSVMSTETTDLPLRETTNRRPSFMSIFQGKLTQQQQPKKAKDLGERKTLPAPPSLSHTDVQANKSSSANNSDSETRPRRPNPTQISSASVAETALANLHRHSPPPSRGSWGGRIRSPSRPRTTDGSSAVIDIPRQPLSPRSPNLALSPLAAELYPGSTQSGMKPLPALPIEESITITRRIPALPSTLPLQQQYASLSATQFSGAMPIPPEYTSQPLTRDHSNNSNASNLTAPPAVPGSASLGTSPMIIEPYLFNRPGPASRDFVGADGGLDLRNTDSTGQVSNLGLGLGLTTDGATGGSTADEWLRRGADSASAVGSVVGSGIRGGVVQFGQMSPVELGAARRRAMQRELELDREMQSLGQGLKERKV